MATSRTRDKVSGAMQFIKGRLKAKSGSSTGNRKRQASGQMDQVKGGARNKKGHAKDLTK